MHVRLKLLAAGAMRDNVRREKDGKEVAMHAWGPLLIKKLDIAILIFLFRNFKDFPKLWAYFTLKLSWPIISDRTNVKKLKEVSINT